jgi:hypothetical protein
MRSLKAAMSKPTSSSVLTSGSMPGLPGLDARMPAPTAVVITV